MLGLTQSYQAQQLGRLANEAGMAMAHASEGDNGGGHFRAFVEVTIFMFSYTVTIFVMLSYGICLTFYGCTQRVRRSCRRMAAKLNCMARPDEDFGALAPSAGASSARGPTSSNRTPIHYGDVTATTPLPFGSRSRSRSTSRTASRAVSRGKLSSHQKPVKSPTARTTQKMKTQPFRYSGCLSYLMLPQERRLRANRAR